MLVHVDEDELLGEISDRALLEEVRARKLESKLRVEGVADLDVVREAYAALLVGRSAEARTILDRILFPKWKSMDGCKMQYRLPGIRQ